MGVIATPINKVPWIIAGAAIVIVDHLLGVSTTIAQRVSEFFSKKAEGNDMSPASLKIELAELLRQRDQPLVIVVDDVDRLTSNEIRLMLRLIKANADLPRMLYFVLFERDAVIHALQQEGFASGERYLEKIVQAQFAVPALQQTMLNDIVVTRLNEILSQLPELPIYEGRWIDLFFQHLHVYFTTLRDVYRFLAAFEFHAGVFRDGESYEVNIVDLFALEILSVFERRIYERLPSNKHILTEGANSQFDRNTDASEKALQDLLEGAQRSEAARAALSDLFPRASWAWGGHHYGAGFDTAWEAAKRVCTETHFDKYFYFALPKGEIAQAELDRFVAGSDSRENSRNFLRRLKQDGRIERFLRRLEVEIDRIPLENAAPFVSAMLDEGDDLPEQTAMFGMDSEMHLARIIYWYLVRLKTVEERECVLKASIRTTDAVSGPAFVVSLEKTSEDRRTDRKPIISEQALADFQQLCASKIAATAERGALLPHHKMVRLLYYWSEWADEAAARQWAESVIQEPVFAVAFLRRFVQYVKSQGMGSLVTRNTPRIDLQSMEKFVSLDLLDATLSDLSATDTEDQQAIKLFRKALGRRRKGLPDREPLSIDDDDE
jgi:predicted KAP-like P-loop ATPase